MCRYAQFSLSSRQLNYRGFPLIFLKPCNENQIIEAVKKASVEIRKRKKIKELIPDMYFT